MPSFCLALEPNDPFVYQWAYKDIGLYEAWDYTVGSDEVIVAIIDNGFDSFHPDLRDNLWINNDEIKNNGLDDDDNGYIDDVYGWNFADDNNDPRPKVDNLDESEISKQIFSHGTMVAGLIGARGDNKKDGVGINWRVKLMNIKVLGNLGSGSLDTMDEAIRYAVDNGADIINISMVGYYTEEMKDAVDYAYEKNVLVVAAAGNNSYSLNGDNSLYPICFDSGSDIQTVFGVSATNEKHHLTSFSNTGSDCIDITAPGANISTTVRFSPTNGLKDRYMGGWNGTSFAAPIISGVAALVKSLQPSWNPIEIMEALISTVHRTPNDDVEGYAQLFGAGFVQANEAVKYAAGFLNGGSKFNHILSFNTDTGSSWDQKIDNRGFSDDKLFLKDIYDVAVYKKSGADLFVVARDSFVEGQIEILTKNKLGDQIGGFRVSAEGGQSIVVGDVYGDSNKEIIIAPKNKSKNLFQVYNLEGKLLKKVDLEKNHKGVSLDLYKRSAGKYDVVVYYKSNSLKLEKYRGNGSLLKSVEIKYFNDRGDITVGDVDNDGDDEFVLTGGEKESAFLLFLESNGKLKRKFSPYNLNYIGALDIDIIDYDGDNKDDVAVYAKKGDQPMRVWTYRAKKIAEWEPFEGLGHVNLELLTY
ncbi:MAG: S8 family serine peptidase [Candidatus Magasanikbacteria bacterium]|nr:S8 family serine peptidase [Candidatus Magasanikbacteria bacterium]